MRGWRFGQSVRSSATCWKKWMSRLEGVVANSA
jgi:hypothetical protein